MIVRRALAKTRTVLDAARIEILEDYATTGPRFRRRGFPGVKITE